MSTGRSSGKGRRPLAAEALFEGLAVDVAVRHVRGAVGQLARRELRRDAGVLHGADEAVGREETLHRAAIAVRSALQDLEHVALAGLLGELGVGDEGQLALADHFLERERTDGLAGLEGFFAPARHRVVNPRVDALLAEQDAVDERVDAITVETAFGEGPGEAGLGGVTTDVLRVEPEEITAECSQIVEREKPLEFPTKNVHGDVHLAPDVGGAITRKRMVTRAEGPGLYSKAHEFQAVSAHLHAQCSQPRPPPGVHSEKSSRPRPRHVLALVTLSLSAATPASRPASPNKST